MGINELGTIPAMTEATAAMKNETHTAGPALFLATEPAST